MEYNIICFGKKIENLKLAILHKTIGSAHGTFETYICPKNHIILQCRGVFWGVGEITSKYYYDDSELWPDKIYPHRFHFELIHFTSEPIVPLEIGFNESMRERFGKGWAFSYIFAPKPLPVDLGLNVEKLLYQGPVAEASKLPLDMP